MKNSKGITLIALIITIIILIILAGVSINILLGKDGLIEKSKNAKEKYEIEQRLEQLELTKANLKLDNAQLTIDNYLGKLEESNVLEVMIDEKMDDNSAYIIIDNNYKYLIEQEESGNLKITYVETTNGLSSNYVTYYVDTDVSYKEKVTENQTCLLPKTFTPSKEGYTFVGWREDNTASEEVLETKKMGDNEITFYAVFSKEVTITYNGNENTEGETTSSTGIVHYNNGNIEDASITLRENGFTKTDYTFIKWAEGSVEGTQYAAGDTYLTQTDMTLYAIWQSNTLTIISDGSLLLPEYIVSNTGTQYYGHSNYKTNPAKTNSTDKYFGSYCQGVASGTHDCSDYPYANITLTLDDSLVGRECTMVGYYYYSARYYEISSAYIKNGTTTVMSFSERNTEKTPSKTFTLSSNTIQMYIKFKCKNSSWAPSGYIGIRSLIIN